MIGVDIPIDIKMIQKWKEFNHYSWRDVCRMVNINYRTGYKIFTGRTTKCWKRTARKLLKFRSLYDNEILDAWGK